MKKIYSLLLAAVMFVSLLPVTASAATTLEIGDTVTLYTSDAYPSYSPTGNVSRSYMWSTSNSSVVRIVSRSGNMCIVQAVGAGTAYVENTQSMSYTYYDPVLGYMPGYETGFGDSYSFKVNPAPPTAVSLPTALSVYAGESGSLSVTYTPSNAGSTLTWKSSNTSVATVTDGTVYGINPGTATITVTTANGLSDTCNVTVTAKDLAFSSSSPADKSTNVAKSKIIKLNFNDNIEESTKYSSIKLTDTTDNTAVTIEKSISDKTLSITPEQLKAGHTYSVSVPAKAVKSIFGKNLTEAVQISFTVKNLHLVSITPEDGEEGVKTVGFDVVFMFEEELTKGENFDDIVVTEAGGEELVTVASIYKNSLSVIPLGLEYSTEYKVTVPVGAINNVDGFPQTEEYVTAFITKPDELKITDSDIKDGETGIAVKRKNKSIYFYFNEYIFKGENFSDICILNNDTNEAVSIGKYAANGSKMMYFTFYEDLDIGCTYTIKIPKGALENSVGEGIKQTSIHFTTASAFDAAAPEIEFDGRMVEITGGNCYYTTDGSDPAVYGVLYEEPFDVERQTTLVRAVNFENGVVSEETSLLCEAPLVKVKNKSVFGGEENDQFYAVAACEYGYVAVGEADKYSFDTARWTDVTSKGGWSDAIIIKYDEDGAVDWKANYGSSSSDSFQAVIYTSDGGIVAVGDKGSAAVIVKYTDDGYIEWSSSVNYGTYTTFYDVCELKDGYVALGYTRTDEGIGGAVIKYDFDGNIVWEKTYVIDDVRFFGGATVEDGFIAAGMTAEHPIMVRYDEDGNVVWQKIYTDLDDSFYAAAADESGIVVINDAAIIKLDHDGSILWTACADTDYSYDDICADEGGYAAVGDDGNDAVIVKYDKDGSLILNETFGSTADDCFTGIDKTENGYIIAGHSAKGGFNKYDWEGCYGYGLIDAAIVEYEYMPEESENDACDKSAALKEISIKGKGYTSRRTKYEVTAFPTAAETGTVTWSVDDDIAVIDENGYLTPLGTGWVTVTAEAKGFEAEYEVYVTLVEPTKLLVEATAVDNGVQLDIKCYNLTGEIENATLVVCIYSPDNIMTESFSFDNVSFYDEEQVYSLIATSLGEEVYMKFMLIDSDNLEPLTESCTIVPQLSLP